LDDVEGIYRPPGNWWDAVAVVTEPAKQLHHGPATAVATATITGDGPIPDPYTWTVPVRLVACDHFL
jgi:hypothetical protein